MAVCFKEFLVAERVPEQVVTPPRDYNDNSRKSSNNCSLQSSLAVGAGSTKPRLDYSDKSMKSSNNCRRQTILTVARLLETHCLAVRRKKY